MRIASPGHAVFAVAMIALGVIVLVTHDFAGVWGGAPAALPGRELILYLCAGVSLACGLGLLWRRTSALAAGVLVAYLLFWLLVFKGQFVVRAPLEEVSYQTSGETAAILAGAWILFAWFAAPRLGLVVGANGVRIARVLFALALIAFGFSHFVYVQMTAPLVPAWLPWHVGWAYFTGGAYLAAGLAVLSGVLARLAAALTALQMGLFALLIWVPLLASGHIEPFQFGEFVVTCVLTASAWVVSDSYRGAGWFALRAAEPAAASA